MYMYYVQVRVPCEPVHPPPSTGLACSTPAASPDSGMCLRAWTVHREACLSDTLLRLSVGPPHPPPLYGVIEHEVHRVHSKQYRTWQCTGTCTCTTTPPRLQIWNEGQAGGPCSQLLGPTHPQRRGGTVPPCRQLLACSSQASLPSRPMLLPHPSSPPPPRSSLNQPP